MFEPTERSSVRRRRLAIVGTILFVTASVAVGAAFAWDYRDRQDADFYLWGIDPNYEPKQLLLCGGTALGVVSVFVLLSSLWRSRL